MNSYDGEEKRKFDNDHNLLIRIDEKMDYLVKTFDKHTLDDDVRFKQVMKDVGVVQRAMWVAIGGFTILQLFLKFSH